MGKGVQLRCRHCGEPLPDRKEDYCGPCNPYLCDRAMPFLLGMILTGRLTTALSRKHPAEAAEAVDPCCSYE